MDGDPLLQLMEGCHLEAVSGNGEGIENPQQPQNLVKDATKMSELRDPGTTGSGSHRPRTGQKMSVLTENQADSGYEVLLSLLPRFCLYRVLS